METKNYLKEFKTLAATLMFSGAAFAGTIKPFPKQGIWRGVFNVSESQVPFNFVFKGKDTKTPVFTLINVYRRDDFNVVRKGKDSIYIKMNTYDAALVAKIEEDGRLSGEYRSLVPGFRGNSLPFTAEHGKAYRFVEPGKDIAPAHNISGKWEIKTYTKEAVPASIAILKQNGNKLTGVVMTVVGDTRELEGTVQGNEFQLSGFTGPSPFIIKGVINADNSISGEQGFGIYKNLKFDAVKNDKVELPDPYALTFLKPGAKFGFTFPDLNGKPVSLTDDKYKGKVVIIETIGTWCPNCTDQTIFLSPWFKKNQQRGVEAIAIGFEQKDDLEYAKYTLGKLRDKYGITYDILFGGIADKKVVAEKLPALNKFIAFPTTIIIDRKGEVREIYTGYTGTVTGTYYADYEKKFNKVLDELLAEPIPAAFTSTSSTSTKSK
jgi:peroxiredoxin